MNPTLHHSLDLHVAVHSVSGRVTWCGLTDIRSSRREIQSEASVQLGCLLVPIAKNLQYLPGLSSSRVSRQMEWNKVE